MKAVFLNVLRLLSMDTLLLGLIEKLALHLIKKLTSLQTGVRNYLDSIVNEAVTIE